ncbi:MAG: aminoacyl-histidine dipeptidase [Oscillospiraceae bacterium]|nr:aminoacyl-histidine dipeptidase [Oscillospiraceae bacterium]
MGILSELQPKEALRFFEEICGIPHGSLDTKRISDYCVRFAQERGLEYVQDEHNNVVIYKPATEGYEDHPTVILQGHLDMVCEKDADCNIDFSKDGLELCHDGEYIFAKGTTLGGDDGIAVAYALALLDAKELKHPSLECVFTVDEEIGMLGADAMDMSVLKGRLLLNCDSEDEGVLTVSCAGGARSDFKLPLAWEAGGSCYRVSVEDLLGGHSGVEIHKGRANANKVLGDILSQLPVRLVRIDGGSKDNAIPRSCVALVCCEEGDFPVRFAAACEEARKALPETETEVRFTCEAATCEKRMTEAASKAVLGLLRELPNGVQAMSQDIEGLVQTSLNLGILETTEDFVRMAFSVRSSVNEEKAALLATLTALSEKYGTAYEESGHYPAWEYCKESVLRDTMVQTFEELYGRTPIVEAIHAGLECGIFCDRLPGLDAVSFGPQMYDIHTSRERLSIESVRRTWDYLVAVLERL